MCDGLSFHQDSCYVGTFNKQLLCAINWFAITVGQQSVRNNNHNDIDIKT